MSPELGELAFLRAASSVAGEHAPMIVCIHGLGGTKEFWQPILPQLTTRGEVIALDLPGFGQSPEPAERWSLRHAASSVRRLIERLELDRVVLVGHSLGAGVAVTAALQDPARICALALVSPAGFAADPFVAPSSRARQLHTAWRVAARPLVAPTLRVRRIRRAFFERLVHDPDTIDHRSMVALAAGSMRARSSVDARAAIMSSDLLPHLAELRMPVHVIWGASDRVTPPQMACHVMEQLPDAHLTMLADVGHLPVWEQPGAVARALLSQLP